MSGPGGAGSAGEAPSAACACCTLNWADSTAHSSASRLSCSNGQSSCAASEVSVTGPGGTAKPPPSSVTVPSGRVSAVPAVSFRSAARFTKPSEKTSPPGPASDRNVSPALVVTMAPSGPVSWTPSGSGRSALATASPPSNWPRSATNKVATSCDCGCVPSGWPGRSPSSPAVSIGWT